MPNIFCSLAKEPQLVEIPLCAFKDKSEYQVLLSLHCVVTYVINLLMDLHI